MKQINLALDWTINTNHSGFVIAKEKGWYADRGLAVKLTTPLEDNYALTPVKRLELGFADVAICPFESIISYRKKETPFYIRALATIFQEDTSAIVTMQREDVLSPKDLDNKHYASYKARYEDKIVQKMIQNAGGKGVLDISYPAKLGIWNTIIQGKADATWIFENWEGVQAERRNIPLTSFKMADFGIPYTYSPVIVAAEETIEKNALMLKEFLEITKKGFVYAMENPFQAAEILKKSVPEEDADPLFLLASQNAANKYYGTKSNWGYMDVKKVQRFLDWIAANDLESGLPVAEELITQNLLP